VTFIIICKERVGFFLVGKKMVFTFSEKKCNKNFTIVFFNEVEKKKNFIFAHAKAKGGISSVG
jgi:hypothetical protein